MYDGSNHSVVDLLGTTGNGKNGARDEGRIVPVFVFVLNDMM